jgi:hypothetical protein
VFEFQPKLSNWRGWSIQHDRIEVAPLRLWNEDDDLTRMLVSASQQLDYRPKVTADNEVVVPEKQRVAAENAIEVTANLVAVSQGCRRAISSPWPPVVFVATGDDGQSWLDSKDGLRHARLMRRVSAASVLDFDASVLNQLQDRLDGVELLVEAFGHSHATGRFHDLVRVFERGFKRPPNRLAAPVFAFLDPLFGYASQEVRDWFETQRDAATHADQRSEFSVEADLRPLVDRMEQAAIDVVFNKERWRDDSTSRRSVWTPRAGTSGADGVIFLTQHDPVPPPMKGELLDEFGRFQMNLSAVITPVPAEWWPTEHPRSSKTEQFQVVVRASERG